MQEVTKQRARASQKKAEIALSRRLFTRFSAAPLNFAETPVKHSERVKN